MSTGTTSELFNQYNWVAKLTSAGFKIDAREFVHEPIAPGACAQCRRRMSRCQCADEKAGRT
jgi:hypothetical protein